MSKLIGQPRKASGVSQYDCGSSEDGDGPEEAAEVTKDPQTWSWAVAICCFSFI